MKPAIQYAIVQWSKYLEYSHSHEISLAVVPSICNPQVWASVLCAYVYTKHIGVTAQIHSWVGEMESA